MREAITGLFGSQLIGLYVYGSWAEGDFSEQRSDLDLLSLVEVDPDETTARRLAAMHEGLAAEFPVWAGRIESEYVSVQALTDFRSHPRSMAKISPGEPLHLVRATSHYALNWYAAREHGQVLVGPDPKLLMPEITAAEARAVVLEHVRQWPTWVQEMATPGRQAYAVLTMCRALSSVIDGRRRSKREAARYAATVLPAWAPLIDWASAWWYEQGSDHELPTRLPTVIAFVDDVTERILAATAS